jgi:hypothetical protein
MGANAQTTVPTFTTGQVLTAAQVNQINTGVPVFADSTARTAAFGGTGEKVLAQGQLSYLESDGKIYVYSGTAWVSISSVTNVAAFTASGTWTVPAGVTYAIAHMLGGGGGVGRTGTLGGAGGTSSVAFASGTVSATGGAAVIVGHSAPDGTYGYTPQANSGMGAYLSLDEQGLGGGNTGVAFSGNSIVAGAAVTPGASITVTVGAGGTAGGTAGFAGASGYVWIEYQV